MTLLEQQELMESPPGRHVVVPERIASPPCWWGIDPSTTAYHIAYVFDHPSDGRRRGVHSVKLGDTNVNEGERLARFRSQMQRLVDAMLDDMIPPPGMVYVEQASGANPQPVLWYSVAVATEAVYDALHHRLDYVPRVETTASAHWKKVATGHGRWNKTKPHPTKKDKTVKLALEEYGVMKWARANGYTGPSWDDADAWGIAEAARRDVEIRG